MEFTQWLKSKNKKYQPWTDTEVNKLQYAIKQYTDEKGTIHWKKVAQFVETRTERQCSEKWNTRIKNRDHKLIPGQVKWSEKEEQLLLQLVKQHGFQWQMFKDFFSKDKNDPVQLKQKYYNMQRRKSKQQGQVKDQSVTIESTGNMFDRQYPMSSPEKEFQEFENFDDMFILMDDEMFTN